MTPDFSLKRGSSWGCGGEPVFSSSSSCSSSSLSCRMLLSDDLKSLSSSSRNAISSGSSSSTRPNTSLGPLGSFDSLELVLGELKRLLEEALELLGLEINLEYGGM